MKPFLLDLLAEPCTNEPLHTNGDNYLINSRSGKHYQIISGVPDFLIGQQNEAPGNCENTVLFDYRDHYEKDAVEFNYFQEDESLLTRNERLRSRQMVINSVPANAVSILDIGCGSAWVAAYFLRLNKQVISMDISTTNPIKALKMYDYPNHAAVIADAFYLPFKNNSIDCIIASEVIEHVPDPARFIKSTISKLKSGGKLILITPYNEKIEYYLCIHCNKPTPKNAHLHSFNESSIKNLTGDGIELKTTAFCNKIFLKLRLYNLLSFLPFSLWQLTDKFANLIFRKPVIFHIEITKK